MELPVDVIERAWRSLVADRGAHVLATDHALQAQFPHQPFDGASGDRKALAVHLPPDLAYPIDAEVLGKDAHHLRLQILIAPGTNREPRWIAPLCDTLTVAGWGNRQNPADRLDPINIPMFVNEGGHRLNGRSSSAWAKYADALRSISLAWRSSRFVRVV